MDALGHERLYRGAALLDKLADAQVLVCGVGALGSYLCDNLARLGVGALRVVDRDRVESHNTGNQLYDRNDVGAKKVDALAAKIYAATAMSVHPIGKELNERSVRSALKTDDDLVVDCFDNAASRRLVQSRCREIGVPCLHLGLYESYGEVVWDRVYTIPKDPKEGDVCEYPLARNVALLTVTVASEAILSWLVDGTEHSYSITLRDLKITERT